MTFQTQYGRYRDMVEAFLRGMFTGEALAGRRPWGRLWEAMGYSLLAGGKRVRPVLVLAVCEALGGRGEDALPLGCALELVHTYSLIHDDLPCMDDDSLRRGRPTCHRVYGEAMAVLAGDALQPEAFRLIAQARGLSAGQRVEAVLALSAACGGDGMAAGQALDIEGGAGDRASLELLCRLKTGALLRAAAELGCIAAGNSGERRRQAAAYAEHVGLAFQARDDMLDAAGDGAVPGRSAFPDLLGPEGCAALVSEETALAKAALEGFPNSAFLLELADSLAGRRQ